VCSKLICTLYSFGLSVEFSATLNLSSYKRRN